MQVHDLQHTTILTFHFGWLVLRVVCPQVVFGTSHQSSPPGCTRIKWICLLIEFHCTESIGHGLQGYQVVLEVGGKNPWTLNMTQANSKLQSVQLESIWCQRVFSPPPCFMSLVVWGNKFPALKCLLTKAVIEMAAFALLSDRHLPHALTALGDLKRKKQLAASS